MLIARIMTVNPQTITPTTVHSAWTGATYVWSSSITGAEIYTLSFPSGATNNGHEIQVSSTNIWSDYGSNNPHTVTDDGTNVTLSSGATTYVVFVKPTSASWISGLGPPSTNSASVNSLLRESNDWVSGTIADSEPSGSYPVTLNSNLVTPAISHTTGTETPFSIPILSRFGTWHLHQNYVTSALNTPIASLVVSQTGTRKKVSCNFW